MVFYLKKWALKKIDKIRRAFLWNVTADAKGAQCLVAWDKIKRPKIKGGLVFWTWKNSVGPEVAVALVYMGRSV